MVDRLDNEQPSDQSEIGIAFQKRPHNLSDLRDCCHWPGLTSVTMTRSAPGQALNAYDASSRIRLGLRPLLLLSPVLISYTHVVLVSGHSSTSIRTESLVP